MPFERPTLTQLVTRAKSDVATRLPGADANLKGSPEEVTAIATAGMTHGVHGHLKWLSKQLLTDLSDDEFLVREAAIYGLSKNPAEFASGPIIWPGTNGTVIPGDGSIIFTRNDGTQFAVTTGGTVSGGSVSLTVTAAIAALAADTGSGTVLTVSSPVTNMTATATVTGGGITDGADLESVDSLRARLLLRKKTPPKGGAAGDYEQWALAVSGTTRAWEFPLLNGPGTVGVFFVRDGDPDIFPDMGAVATMQAALNAAAPVTADVTAYSPTPQIQNFTIHIVPNNSDTESSVEAELAALFLDAARPGDGTGDGTILLSQINDAVGIASGVTDYLVTVPNANVVPSAIGNMIAIGVITWD